MASKGSVSAPIIRKSNPILSVGIKVVLRSGYLCCCFGETFACQKKKKKRLHLCNVTSADTSWLFSVPWGMKEQSATFGKTSSVRE